MSRTELPVAIDRAHTLWVWLDGHLVDFPAAARPLAGRRLCDAATDLLDALLQALLLRGARERRYLSIAQHDHAIERLGEIGRMIGGWLRASRNGAP